MRAPEKHRTMVLFPCGGLADGAPKEFRSFSIKKRLPIPAAVD